jgi:hypothetical protein
MKPSWARLGSQDGARTRRLAQKHDTGSKTKLLGRQLEDRAGKPDHTPRLASGNETRRTKESSAPKLKWAARIGEENQSLRSHGCSAWQRSFPAVARENQMQRVQIRRKSKQHTRVTKTDFFIAIQTRFQHRNIEVTVLPPLFDYWNNV